MKQIRKRITYANVMSSLAVFLVLGGATAFAANQLGKNSVGSKQIKKNAVSGAKLKKSSVTGAKIAKNAVDGSKVKDGSLTGADLDLGTIGTVPSANTANSAKTAESAKKTEQVVNIFYRGNEGDPTQTILDAGGLKVTETCGYENELEATTSVSHSVIDVVTAQDNDYSYNIDFNVGETFDLDEAHSEGATEMYTAQYTRPDGTNVVIVLHDIDSSDGPAFPGTSAEADCMVSGLAFVS